MDGALNFSFFFMCKKLIITIAQLVILTSFFLVSTLNSICVDQLLTSHVDTVN